MSGIPIKDIPGAILEKKNGILANPKFPSHKPGYNPVNEGFNSAITLQGQVKITLSRDKLAKKLYEMHNYSRTFESNKPKWEDLSDDNKDISGFRWQAYEIIQHLNELLEVVK